jgi:inorganic pyrophosphatase
MDILVHRYTYIHKVLKKFNMDKVYPGKTSMIVLTLEMDTDPFRSWEEGEEVLSPEFSYLSVIGALMYLTNNTRPDIVFAVNLLTRHSTSPTIHHWNRIKNTLWYLQNKTDLGLFLKKNQDPCLCYLSDRWTAISWKSSKQTLLATSTNVFARLSFLIFP